MQGYGYHNVRSKLFQTALCHLRKLVCKPPSQRSDISILQHQDRACHGRRIGAETSNKIKVIRAEAAEVELQRGHALGHCARDDWTAAACALRLRKRLR